MEAATSKCSLRVLVVEDNPDDAALCQRLLRKVYPEARCDVIQTPRGILSPDT